MRANAHHSSTKCGLESLVSNLLIFDLQSNLSDQPAVGELCAPRNDVGHPEDLDTRSVHVFSRRSALLEKSYRAFETLSKFSFG